MLWFGSSFQKDLKYIIFGRYYTDDFGQNNYNIYKLTRDQLYIDKSETWHTKHDFGNTYKFHGYAAFDEKFESVKELLDKVPQQINSKKLERYGKNFGSKHQDNLIIEIFDGTQKTNVLIDSYIIEKSRLPRSLRKFRKLVEETIKKLENT